MSQATIDVLKKWGAIPDGTGWRTVSQLGKPRIRWTPTPFGGWYRENWTEGKWVGATHRMWAPGLVTPPEIVWEMRDEFAKRVDDIRVKHGISNNESDIMAALDDKLEGATEQAEKNSIILAQVELRAINYQLEWPDEYVRNNYKDGVANREKTRAEKARRTN